MSMHPSSALKKEETEAVFSNAALLNKIDRRHKMTNAKQTFVNLKKTKTITEIRF